MSRYDKIRGIMDEATICKIKECLPEKFSSEDFMLFFLLFFPPEHAELIKPSMKDKRLLNWLNSHYIREIDNHFKQLCKQITQPYALKWTKDVNYIKFSFNHHKNRQ
ncbi:MAG: hypothetical protein IJV42_02750 [Bacteroidaceae bacterium]|nr:hypothetical protein [Bacteroidaceae bacterium]